MSDNFYYIEDSPFLAPFDASFSIEGSPTKLSDADKDKCKDRLKKSVKELKELQQLLYAHDRFSVLCVFQAMDAAGKDSTISAVFSGVNPAGFQVFNFKKPSDEALDHDFLWRSSKRLPERGRIGVFNRSYYEEVLVVRVHQEILRSQKLPKHLREDPWGHRLESIRALEEHLFNNGTVVIKFFLNVSKDEQRDRFLSRLDVPEKNWKFEPNDIRERKHWKEYMRCYESLIQATSQPYAPWYVIPADSKTVMRAEVAEIIVKTLKSLPLHYPRVPEEARAEFAELRQFLEND